MKVCSTNHIEIAFDDNLYRDCPCCTLVKEEERRHQEDLISIGRAAAKPLNSLQAEITKYEELLDAALSLCNGMGFEFLNSTEKHRMVRLSKACANMNR